jgi:hypothetical protein
MMLGPEGYFGVLTPLTFHPIKSVGHLISALIAIDETHDIQFQEIPIDIRALKFIHLKLL